MKSKDEKWALFWCKLLHPIIFGEIEREQTNQFLKDICLQDIVFPNGKRKRPSISTLRRKLNQYRKDGFQSLARKARIDRGTSRKFSREIIDKAVELKKNNLAVATIPSTGFSRNTIRRRSPNPRFIATSNSRAQPSSSSASHNKRCVYAGPATTPTTYGLVIFRKAPMSLLTAKRFLPTFASSLTAIAVTSSRDGTISNKPLISLLILSSGPGLFTARQKNSTSIMPRSTFLTLYVRPVTVSVSNSGTDLLTTPLPVAW